MALLALNIVDSNENLCGPVGTSSDIASKRGFFVCLFECNRELKRFLRDNAVGIWIIKIHLNPKSQSGQSIRAFSYFLFIKHSLHQYSHSLTFVWPSTNTGNSCSLFLPQILQIPLFAVDISMTLNYRESTEKPSQSMYNIVCSGLVGIGFLHAIGILLSLGSALVHERLLCRIKCNNHKTYFLNSIELLIFVTA
jgi:hypothetical protein